MVRRASSRAAESKGGAQKAYWRSCFGVGLSTLGERQRQGRSCSNKSSNLSTLLKNPIVDLFLPDIIIVIILNLLLGRQSSVHGELLGGQSGGPGLVQVIVPLYIIIGHTVTSP